MNILLIPDITQAGLGPAIKDDIVNLLTWDDFAKYAWIGYISIVGSNGKEFNPLSNCVIKAPPLYVWQPITFNVLPSWPVSGKGFELPIKVGLSFPNPGPLHLDMGEISIQVRDGDKTLLKVGTPGSMIVKNVLEGGNDNRGAGNPTHGEFHVTFPFGDIIPTRILNLIKDLLTKGDNDNIHLELLFFRDGENVKWLEHLVSDIVQSGAIKKVIPFIGVVLGHIKLEVLDLDASQTKFYKEIVKLIEKWVAQHFPVLGSNMESVGIDIAPTVIRNGSITSPIKNETLHVRAVEGTFSPFVIFGH